MILTRLALRSAAFLLPLCAIPAQSAPRVDHHQHLFSAATVALIAPPPADSTAPRPPALKPIVARDLIALLDSAGIQRALVLSMGYTWGAATRTVANEYEKVRAENDWTSEQVAQYPDRLRAFCSFNPVKDYALAELARCMKDPRLRLGLKLHIGNSGADYHDARHVRMMREVFRAANANRMAIVIHMRSSISLRLRYGRDEARMFLDSILPAAPDVPVQIAHMAGSGGFDSTADGALSVFIDAIAKRDPRMKNVLFDATVVARPDSPPEELRTIAARIRQVGVERVLYGSDAATGGNSVPRAGWAAFRKLPLTTAEFMTIANNVAPYMRW